MRKLKLGRLAIRCTVQRPDIRARLEALPAAIRSKVLAAAVSAGGEVLADGVRRRMPVDTGTARDAVEMTVRVNAEGRGAATIDFDADAIRALAPNHEFYVAAIEYGTADRPPVAPLRRTLDRDGEAAARAAADAAEIALKRM